MDSAAIHFYYTYNLLFVREFHVCWDSANAVAGSANAVAGSANFPIFEQCFRFLDCRIQNIKAMVAILRILRQN